MPENTKSRKIYKRHQHAFLVYMKEEKERGFDENTIVNYFSEIYAKGLCSTGSFWCMFSCIRSYIIVKTKIDIKNYVVLKKLLNGLTAKHLAKKQTFSPQKR